ncbi:tRNA (guanosine-2'-O-)-methyltransferase [Desulfovibrionales bacterium]
MTWGKSHQPVLLIFFCSGLFRLVEFILSTVYSISKACTVLCGPYPKVFKSASMIPQSHHPGQLALARIRGRRIECTPERAARIRQVLARRQSDLTVILANIHDPHNVSAIYRSCDAFGVARVHLYYTDTAFPALGHKTSGSALKWVETIRYNDAAVMVAALRGSIPVRNGASKGYQILATSLSPWAVPLVACDLTRPTAIVFGNEHRGVDPELIELVDHEMCIPMQGMVQSLNVSAAAAVALFEAWRQRHARGFYDAPAYPLTEFETFVTTWCAK